MYKYEYYDVIKTCTKFIYTQLSKMAGQEPNVYEFCALTASEELATVFAQENGLLLSAQQLQQVHQHQQ